MRTKTLNEIIEKLKIKEYPYKPVFWNKLLTEGDYGEELDLDIQIDENGIQAGYEYEYGNIFIVGLTSKEKEYILGIRR